MTSERAVPRRPRTVLLRGLLSLGAIFTLAHPTEALAAKKKDDWPKLTPEERKLTSVPQDPTADAVVLLKERTGRIVRRADDWVNILHYFHRLKVLTESGEEFGEVRIPAEKYSRVSNIEARTVRPDGTTLPVEPDQIFEEVVLEVGSFQLKEWVFHFPAVEPGAILEYRYVRHDNFLLFIEPWYYEGPVFTVRSRVEQAIPDGASYMVLCDLCGGAQPQTSKWRDGENSGELYSMELTDLPGFHDDILMPPRREVSPRLEMVLKGWRGVFWKALGRQDDLFTDWKSVARWAREVYAEAAKQGQNELKPLVEQWVAGLDDAEARTRSVFRHVQEDFRYIPYSRVVGGSRPLDALLKAGNADNEEKAVLLHAALGTIGVDSQIALVAGNDFGSLNPKFFSLSQFTHAVVILTGAEGTQTLLDPTLGYAPFGFSSWKDSGAPCLIVHGEGDEVTALPKKRESNRTSYDLTIRPRRDGKAEVDAEIELTGEDALDWRAVLVPASESSRRDIFQEWLEEERPGAVLSSFGFDQMEDPEKPLVIHASFEAPGLVTVADEALTVQACVLSCYESSPLRPSRQHPFYVDRGWRESQSIRILAPEGMEPASPPMGVTAKVPVGSLSFRCSSTGDRLTCTRTFSGRRNRWSAAEFPRVQALFEKAVAADHTAVAFQPAGS